MRQFSIAILLLLLALEVRCGGGTIQFRQQDLPGKINFASVFDHLDASLCKVDVSPISARVAATPCLCSDTSKSVALANGPFAPTTCFRITSMGAANVQLKVTCTDSNMTKFLESNVRVTITDSAPQCRNYTVAVASGATTRFFLLASDPDDDFFEYHVRNASVSALKGELRYCATCGPDTVNIDDPANWILYTDAVSQNVPHRFSRMFSYRPPKNATDETLMFTARDLSDQFCTADGTITFHASAVSAPKMDTPSNVNIYIGRPEVIQISATSEFVPMRFAVRTVPSCAILCRVTEAARTTLRDFPGEKLSGDILEPCTKSNQLKPSDDITLLSSKDTFFTKTFVTVKADSSCSGEKYSSQSFSAVASFEGAESQPVTQTLVVVDKVHRCVPFHATFQPSKTLKIRADQFVSLSGEFTLTSLATGDFQLQLAGGNLVGTGATESSELAFRGTKSVDVTVMVKSSQPPWTGYCKLAFSLEGAAQTLAPPRITTLAPTDAPGSHAPVTARPFGDDDSGTSSGRSTMILVLVAALVALAFYFRSSLSRFLGTSQATTPSLPRRYGVVAGDTADD